MNKYETWHKLKEPLPEVDKDGSKYWYNENGQLNREFGPAVILLNGYKAWYKHGVRHREDGPALEFANGNSQWHLNGIECTEEEFNEQIRNMA